MSDDPNAQRPQGYAERVLALARTLNAASFREQGVRRVLVVHDDTCPRPRGGRCACDPEIQILGGPHAS